jgi:hypothetical protein
MYGDVSNGELRHIEINLDSPLYAEKCRNI